MMANILDNHIKLRNMHTALQVVNELWRVASSRSYKALYVRGNASQAYDLPLI